MGGGFQMLFSLQEVLVFEHTDALEVLSRVAE